MCRHVKTSTDNTNVKWQGKTRLEFTLLFCDSL